MIEVVFDQLSALLRGHDIDKAASKIYKKSYASLIAKIKEVHSASIRKGLPVPTSYEFMNSIIEGSLEQYINQYGLRKVMNQLPNPNL